MQLIRPSRSLALMLTGLVASLTASAVLTSAVGPAVAQSAGPSALSTAKSIGTAPAAEVVRLCGTNSSRSRRCYFGNKDCLRNGHSKAECDRAIAICHSCIDGMVACTRDAANSCSTCVERYSSCMQPWVAIIE